jgi:hypothetical protein
VVRWDGNANLNLAVSTPSTAANVGGEFIYPIAGFTHAPSGGQTAIDHRGGPNGGIEIVYFQDNFPTGIYGLSAPSSSSSPVNAILQGFLDGQPVPLFDGLQITNRVEQVVANPIPGPALALASVGGPFPPGLAPPSLPLKASSLRKPIDISNPPKAVMVGPKPAARSR